MYVVCVYTYIYTVRIEQINTNRYIRMYVHVCLRTI